jgi:hypothetical protein
LDELNVGCFANAFSALNCDEFTVHLIPTFDLSYWGEDWYSFFRWSI